MKIGERIKRYEAVSNILLTPRSSVILRVDGKAFHTFTRGCNKPFDFRLIEAMIIAGEKTSREMMNFKLGYHQSDEFSFLLIDNESHETQPWFNNELQKLVSITASMFTAYFNKAYGNNNKQAFFDCRAFNVPREEVPNVFIWRQRDWERNSIQMCCRSFFSHKDMIKKNKREMQEMLYTKGADWDQLDMVLKYGTFVLPDGSRVNEKLDYNKINSLIK